MSLTDSQLKRIRKTLLATYAHHELRRAVESCMDVDYPQIAPARDFAMQVHSLVRWAARERRILELVQCAWDNNFENEWLGALWQVTQMWCGEQISLPQDTHNASQIGIEWVTIPAGIYISGSDWDVDVWSRDDNDPPLHTILLPEYRIARFPVTVAQYATFVKATGYVTLRERQPPKWERFAGTTWRQPRGTGSDVLEKQNHPVTCVSWHDALAFCRWIGARLPSETEWEKAARGTDARTWPWGFDPPNEERCNFNNNVGDTTPVDQYPNGASPFGVLDMVGNIEEWASSRWSLETENVARDDYVPRPFRIAYGQNSLTTDPSLTEHAVECGGSWEANPGEVRCADISRFHPNPLLEYAGFRVASFP